jgi:hypothetical protein
VISPAGVGRDPPRFSVKCAMVINLDDLTAKNIVLQLS